MAAMRTYRWRRVMPVHGPKRCARQRLAASGPRRIAPCARRRRTESKSKATNAASACSSACADGAAAAAAAALPLLEALPASRTAGVADAGKTAESVAIVARACCLARSTRESNACVEQGAAQRGPVPRPHGVATQADPPARSARRQARMRRVFALATCPRHGTCSTPRSLPVAAPLRGRAEP